MITKIRPDDFNKRFDVVGCYLIHEGSFVMLHRHAHKANGDLWGLPGGKVEPGESLVGAMVREIEEETGLELLPSDVHFFGSYYVRHDDFDFEWHMFSAELPTRPRIQISTYEHKDFKWVTPREGQLLPLIPDMGRSIKLFFK